MEALPHLYLYLYTLLRGELAERDGVGAVGLHSREEYNVRGGMALVMRIEGFN